MFAVVGPLRRTTLIQRGLAVHNKHPRLLSVYVVPDICVVVAVWTEGDTLYRTVGNLRLAVKNKTGVIPIGWSFHMQVREEEDVLAVGSEIQSGILSATPAALRLATAHQFFAVHDHNVLIAGARAVGIALAVRTKGHVA